MRAVLCSLIIPPVALVFALLLTGCNAGNESNMAETKGVAAPNAPKTQAEFYKQSQEIDKSAQKGRAK